MELKSVDLLCEVIKLIWNILQYILMILLNFLFMANILDVGLSGS